MNEYEKLYAEISKKYYESDGAASAVEAIYLLKERLESVDEREAKLVPVSVYELLDMKKSAYELLLKVADKKDKKQLKKLGYLAQFLQSHGDKFALKRPKNTAQLKEQDKKLQSLPKFRYHPNPLATGAFRDDISVECECCGRETSVYYGGSVYSMHDVNYLCPHCIADGSAAAKFDAEFIQDADPLDDADKSDELFKRTPGYASWQGEHWLVCCDDYCEFHGDVGTKEPQEMGVADEVFERYELRGEFSDVRDCLSAGGDIAGYLFYCPRCGKYQIYVDAS